ncbi:MAG: hypothetical protein EOO43_26345, partial [Flavobacterium sp.]
MTRSNDFDDDLLLTPSYLDDDFSKPLDSREFNSDDLSNISSISSEKKKTEAEMLEELRMMQTKFVFLYGDAQAGKSAVCASMIHYIMTNADIGFFEDRGLGNNEGKNFIRDAVRAM